MRCCACTVVSPHRLACQRHLRSRFTADERYRGPDLESASVCESVSGNESVEGTSSAGNKISRTSAHATVRRLILVRRHAPSLVALIRSVFKGQSGSALPRCCKSLGRITQLRPSVRTECLCASSQGRRCLLPTSVCFEQCACLLFSSVRRYRGCWPT